MQFQREKYFKIRHRIFQIFHEEFQDPKDRIGKFVVRFITILIALNVLIIILDSLESVHEQYHEFFLEFEDISIIIFTVEYFCHVWTCIDDPKYSFGIVKGRLRYMGSILAIVDLIAILPFYLPQFLPMDLLSLRILRLFRIFHLFTLGHFSEAFDTIGQVLKEKKEALIMIGFIGTVIIVFSSILLYEIEHPVQPEVFSNMFDVMYWVALSLASIQHGQMYPITPLGEAIGAIIGILGIAFFILPTGIIASGFIAHMQKKQQNPHKGQNGIPEKLEDEVNPWQIDIEEMGKKEREIETKKKHHIHCPHCHSNLILTDNHLLELISTPAELKNPTPYRKMQKWVFDLLNSHDEHNIPARLTAIFIMGLIVLNVISVMLETVESFTEERLISLYYFDTFSVIIFTIEYSLRLWSCVVGDNPDYHSPIKGRIRYALSPMALIDLLAIIPTFIPMWLDMDLRFLRILRIFRFIRIFKFGHYSNTLEHLASVFREEESLGVTFFIMVIMLIFISTLIYDTENRAQPEVFTDIPQTMWWLLSMLTTVGAEDVYPITVWGKLLSVIMGFLNMCLLALPTGIIGAGFADFMQREEHALECPHCKSKIIL